MNDWNKESNASLLRRIGASVKGSRLQKNISQSDLAQISGVSLASITRLETGKGNTSLGNLLAILKALEIADKLKGTFSAPEESPALLAKASSHKTQERVKRSVIDEAEDEEWKWGEDRQ